MTKKITFPRWPSEFLANLCQPICLGRLTGQHWFAGNSEGHHGISKFLFLMVPYNCYGALATGIREVAFFYHLRSQSYIVICSRKSNDIRSYINKCTSYCKTDCIKQLYKQLHEQHHEKKCKQWHKHWYMQQHKHCNTM